MQCYEHCCKTTVAVSPPPVWLDKGDESVIYRALSDNYFDEYIRKTIRLIKLYSSIQI
jgi:hypothetical protein